MSDTPDAPNGAEDTNGTPFKSSTPHSKSGWDGKLRVNNSKQTTLANPEALYDPDYSDDDAPPVHQIAADEGKSIASPSFHQPASTN